LGGYVVSALKPGASTVLASHLDDPILATWRAGLGRVGVFTADLGSSWSTQLRTWADGSRMWVQVFRWLSRRVIDPAVDLSIAETNAGPRTIADTRSRTADVPDFSNVSAVVRSPSGGDEALVLEETTPGRYEAPLPVSQEGTYVVAVTLNQTDGSEH